MLVQRPGEERVARLLVDRSDSPVMEAWLTLLTPSTTTPSTGMLSPGRTMTMSPTTSSAMPTSFVSAPRLQSAVSGRSFISAVMAERLRSMASSWRVWGKREEEEKHRALEGVMDVGRAERRQDHEQVDVDHAGEKRADPVDRPVPAAREVGGEEKPGRRPGGKAQPVAKAAQEHEGQRRRNAPRLRVGPERVPLMRVGVAAAGGGRGVAHAGNLEPISPLVTACG